MEKKTTKSVAVLCEEARLAAASKLMAIVNACAVVACGPKVSVPHAKFVADIAQLPAPALEKRPKPADDKEESSSAAEEPCLTEVFIRMLKEQMVDPVP
jgi:hypothetical protein